MQSLDLKQEPMTEKNRRRTRNDNNDRNFTCGCGKSYLSYPALYTHLKQKHNGLSPAGTVQPHQIGKGQRGRPKKEENLDNNYGTENSSNTENKDCFEELLFFIQDLQIKKKEKFIKDDKETLDAYENFPISFFTFDRYHLIYENLHKIGCVNFDEQEQNDEFKSCDQIFALFLYVVSKHLTLQCYQEICYFIIAYRDAMNHFGPKLEQYQLNQEYCNNHDANDLPLISNKFLHSFLPDFLRRYSDPISNFKIVGLEIEKIKNSVFLTQYFCEWLLLNKFTDKKLILSNNSTQYQYE